MKNPIAPRILETKKPKLYNPLDDDYDINNYNRYDWWRSH